ncbi:hypothetical protein DHEL01_v201172 [Diaporthe helianthi]|uniref:Uncharacterized protein n=1 Tax=Diaporthe helianthi TaxID=158607 RepID=A0A2P5ID60_DIAHE|nr:hypothetical protein DHEL01_v201172 [Diaporthe helianthi]
MAMAHYRAMEKLNLILASGSGTAVAVAASAWLASSGHVDDMILEPAAVPQSDNVVIIVHGPSFYPCQAVTVVRLARLVLSTAKRMHGTPATCTSRRWLRHAKRGLIYSSKEVRTPYTAQSYYAQLQHARDWRKQAKLNSIFGPPGKYHEIHEPTLPQSAFEPAIISCHVDESDNNVCALTAGLQAHEESNMVRGMQE